MPVSFLVAKHAAKPFTGQLAGQASHTANEFFALACTDQHTKAGEMLQFSLPVGQGKETDGSRNIDTKIPNIVPNKNGFVATLLDAYTQDRALVIRPDYVWLAILCQFNFFVNANAELLRASFVAHEGKKKLIIDVVPATRYTVDYGHLARQMTGLVEKNVVDPALRKYFDYTLRFAGCGIPRITLEGGKSDWENILQRLEKLKDSEFGFETTAWYHLLRPGIRRFIRGFEDPMDPNNVKLWQRVAHYAPGGSGRGGDHYSGWITAFMVFNKDGWWIRP
ncbi:hypothetical protein MSAN_02013000 [Mycena sanguinolenta]|uniref:Uncharacterized protein n=1 Tax=Mycena sanguinolenta TaxID=230812 RepID=A0A8H7CNJ4_9AGAR|nr:hypothetical protein MSAN_02013000 [Mycena sanguinolenta]